MPTNNAREVEFEFKYALSYELLRATLREQLKSMPRRMLAGALGVNVRQLSWFMRGGHPSKRLYDAACAFSDGMQAQPPEVELEAVALNLIADTFDTRKRPQVRRALAEAIRPVLLAEGRTLETL